MKLSGRYFNEVMYFTDVISDSKALITAIDSSADIEWYDWSASDSKDNVFGKQYMFTSTPNSDTEPELGYIYDTVKESIEDVANQYCREAGLEQPSRVSDFVRLSFYQPGAYMGPHADSFTDDTDLKYSIVLYLNDDYEGGDIVFSVNGVEERISPQAGSALVFPSTLPFIHRVETVTSGRRFMSPGFIYKQGSK